MGTALYAYVLTRANLPEEWGYWIGGGVLLGALIGSWYALIGSLAPLVWVFSPEASGSAQEEINAWLAGVYVPGSFLAITCGIAMRGAIRAAVARTRRAKPCD